MPRIVAPDAAPLIPTEHPRLPLTAAEQPQKEQAAQTPSETEGETGGRVDETTPFIADNGQRDRLRAEREKCDFFVDDPLEDHSFNQIQTKAPPTEKLSDKLEVALNMTSVHGNDPLDTDKDAKINPRTGLPPVGPIKLSHAQQIARKELSEDYTDRKDHQTHQHDRAIEASADGLVHQIPTHEIDIADDMDPGI